MAKLRRIAKKPSFMQQYRRYNRSPLKTGLKPTLDQHCLNEYGYTLASLFEKQDRITHGISKANVHKRIHYRCILATQKGHSQKRKCELEKMWREWAVL